MKFGLFFTLQLPRPWDEDSERTLFREALAQVELAEQLGFDAVWVVEQHFLEEYSHSSSPEVFLAAASQRTSRIRLGHGVVLMPPAYNAPARVAERIATLDVVSDGRVEFGVGDSKSRMELEGFGIPPDDRRAMSMEALAQVTDMMAMEPYPGYAGRFMSMPPRNVVPKPTQKPHPPLWIACSDEATMRTAAQLGLGVLAHTFFDADEARRVVTQYHETLAGECVPIGHAVNPNVATLAPFFCSRDEAAREMAFDAFGFLTFAVRHYYSFGRHVPGRTNVWERAEAVRKELGGQIPWRGGHAVGSPDHIAAFLRPLEDAGVDQIILTHQAGRMAHDAICASLRLFAAEVMPEFADRERLREERRREELAPVVAAALVRKQRRAAPADEDLSVCEAYGLSRPEPDLSALPAHVGQQLRELQRVKQIAIGLDP
jgi:alkanesulfonate monooxygenase SsuD/methylene tetrahydromethanopterin reductase-like flavin-dependent oxidoreductase (luciferase family)